MLSSRRVIRSERFHMHYCITANGPVPRLGLIVPKKLAKAASLRNAVKRQMREVFRLQAEGLPAVDLVFRLNKPLKGIRATDSTQIVSWRVELESLLKRLPVVAA